MYSDFVPILQRRKRIILTFLVITVAAVTVVTLAQKKIYRATATVVIDSQGSHRDYVNTQKGIIHSRRTAYHVIKNLKLGNLKKFRLEDDPIGCLLKKLRVEAMRDTRILKISVDDEDPKLASLMANEFARVYADSIKALRMNISVQEQSLLEEGVEKAKKKARDSKLKLQTYKERNDIVFLQAQENLIKNSLAELSAESNLSDELKETLERKKRMALEVERKILNYNVMQREVETNEKMLQIALDRLKEAPVSQVELSDARVQDLAEIPREPVKPRKMLNISLAVLVGCLGGISLAFFRDYMDAAIKEPSNIAGLLEVPVLGAVPRMTLDGKNIKKKEDIDRIVEKDVYSLASEAYRAIRSNLLFSINHSASSRSIVITSSAPKEGKTITAVNLAIMIANSGENVLLVDADMRKPRIHKIFNETVKPGLLQLLAGENDLDYALRDPGIDNLHIITAGKNTQNPAELLTPRNMKLFLEQAGARFPNIIFDTSPVSLGTGARILSGIATGVILIAEEGRSTRNLLVRSRRLLENSDAKILGVIVNNLSLTRDGYS